MKKQIIQKEVCALFNQHLKFFDMFAGIGGFRSGLTNVGDFFMPTGFCEIDPYVRKAYEAIYESKGELFFEDARTINPEALPDLDLICGGFPCQSFSIAGKRGGFEDARGTLFFEIARIAAVKRPAYLLLENVPGLLSHDEGRTFATILGTLDELGYNVAWQVLNSADYYVPQSRKRLFIVAFLRTVCSGSVLAFVETSRKTCVQKLGGRQGDRVYAAERLSCTLTSNGGGFAGNTGLYLVRNPPMDYTEDGITFSFIDLNEDAKLTELARCITTRQDSGISNHKGEHSGVFVSVNENARAILTPEKENIRQQGRRIKEPEEAMFTLTCTDRHGVITACGIRKLMPIECWRLQGFTDEQFYKAQNKAELSDARLYKMAGNAVTVTVITALGEFLKTVHETMVVKKRKEE